MRLFYLLFLFLSLEVSCFAQNQSLLLNETSFGSPNQEESLSTSANQSLNLVLSPSGNVLEVQVGFNHSDLLEVYNVLGNKVKSIRLNDLKTSLDISDIPEGIYMVALKQADSTITRKLNLVR